MRRFLLLLSIVIAPAIASAQTASYNNSSSCSGTLVTTVISTTCSGTQDLPDDGLGDIPTTLKYDSQSNQIIWQNTTNGSSNSLNVSDISVPISSGYSGNLPADAISLQFNCSSFTTCQDVVGCDPSAHYVIGDGTCDGTAPYTIIAIDELSSSMLGTTNPQIFFQCSGQNGDSLIAPWNFISPFMQYQGIVNRYSGTVNIHCNGTDDLLMAAGGYFAGTIWVVPYDTRQSTTTMTQINWSQPIIIAGFWTAIAGFVIILWIFKKRI